MSSSNSNSNSKQALQIKHDDKFFSRLMSKEASAANSSGRVYYGGASGAIPFVWELQPGTPKHPSAESTLPPLTPPPSYFCRSKPLQRKNRSKAAGNLIMSYVFTKSSKSNVVVDPTISSWSASSTSSSSSWSSYGSPLASVAMNNNNSSSKIKQYHHQMIKRSYFVPVCTRSTVVCGVDEEEEDKDDEEYGLSPTSTPCFGVKLRLRRNFKLGCYSAKSLL